MKWPKPKAAAAFVLGTCAIAALLDQIPFLSYSEGPPAEGLRRSLQLSEKEDDDNDAAATESSRIQPRAKVNLQPLRATPDSSKETFVFWHIPKSGGTTAKAIYRCLGKTIFIESQRKQISRVKEAELVASGKIDIIFSSSPEYAVKQLPDKTKKARMAARTLAIFRNPVDRLISKFFYLQIAFWEKSYRPEWKDMDILEWVQNHNSDKNLLVKELAAKTHGDATEEDFKLAKETLKKRFVVGLMNEMEESIHRFNSVMGIDEEDNAKNTKCMKSYFGTRVRKENSNAHPKVEKDSPAYKLLAEQNNLDLKLYEYVVELFKEQKDIVDLYEIDMDHTKVTAPAKAVQ